MRKYFLIGFVAVGVGWGGAYWLFFKQSNGPIVEVAPVSDVPRFTKQETDDAEASDVIEPLIVDSGTSGIAAVARPIVAEEPMPRAQWTPGMTQPSRPGTPLRMPYADEKELFFLPFDPIQWILESPLPRLDLFDELDPAEEAEPMEIVPPLLNPHHHPHCPHMGGCPAPSFPYRMGPR